MTDKGFRYRHSEGITSLALSGDGSKLITCGSDGDVRVYEDFDDDEPVTFSASDLCLGLTCFEDKVIVGTENNTVEMYELPKGKNLGVKAKFTGAVNHVDVSKDGKWLVAGAGDMTLQIISLNDTTNQPRKIDGHRAPVLSVAIDPLGRYFVSSGCDGCVCVWNLIESATRLVKKWDNVFQSSNDISLSPTLCRMSWTPNGQFLAVPQQDMSVSLYSRETWEPSRSYKSKDLTKMVSVMAFSSCGTYLSVGGANGAVIIWNTLTADPLLELPAATDKNGITGITFNRENIHIYFTDDRGRFGRIENFSTSANAKSVKDTAGNVVDVFDDGLDDLFDDADNENEFSISKIKAEVGFIEDEYVGIDKATKELGIKRKDLDDDESSVMSDDSRMRLSNRLNNIPAPVNPFTVPQGYFQPSSTPVRLEHRFMVWNNIGIIRSYSTDDDDAIDIEFHDISFHNSVHLRNQFDFVFGSISNEVIVLACEKGSRHPSKVFCLNFGTWDSSKEWTVDLPEDEEVTTLAVGSGWIAVSTSLNRLRLFSTGGCQKFIYELPGTVVAMAGFEDLIFITYHSGVGVNGNQSIAYSLFKIRGCKLLALKTDIPLPLTPKSTLTWIGFTDEGTPTFSDSKETLRILSGELWTPYCYMKELLSGPNDHFWILGASETGQNVRAVKCKGSKYPPTLPRPTLMILDAKIPVCELDTEKSQMEEKMLRAFLLSSISKKMDKKGFDIDEHKEKAEKDIRETLMKLFVMSSKGDRDLRASEYISLMPSAHAVQVAVKFASRLHRSALTDHLTRIGRKKMAEEEESEDEDDFETRVKTNFIRYGNIGLSNSLIVNPRAEDSFGVGFNDQSDNSMSSETCRRTAIPVTENPLLKKQKDEIRAILAPTPLKTNPFRKGIAKKLEDDSQSQSQETGADGTKGLSFIDAWKKPPEKPAVFEFNPKHPQSKKTKKAAAEKDKSSTPPVAKVDKKKQPTLFDMGGKMSKKSTILSSLESSPLPINENSNSTTKDNENSEPLISGVGEKFIDINTSTNTLEKKRKRSGDDLDAIETENNMSIADPEKKKRIALKLSVFSKKQED